MTPFGEWHRVRASWWARQMDVDTLLTCFSSCSALSQSCCSKTPGWTALMFLYGTKNSDRTYRREREAQPLHVLVPVFHLCTTGETGLFDVLDTTELIGIQGLPLTCASGLPRVTQDDMRNARRGTVCLDY